MKINLPGWAKLLLKIIVSGICLWYVGSKIDWKQSVQLLRHANAAWLLAAFACFMLSKLLAAIRLQLYFDNIGLSLLYKKSIALYWLGMFYNLFLPGGIGGDAYKVMLLRKTHPEISSKHTGSAVLIDRISGVAGLGVLLAASWYVLAKPAWHSYAIIVVTLLSLIGFYWIIRKWFPVFLQSFESTLLLGLVVQLFQVACVLCIIKSIGSSEPVLPLVFLFLLSSIVAIFPFTIGGLGARELVFLWGSQYFTIQQDQAVLISLIFYLITVAGSLPGIIWLFKPIHLKPQ